MAPGAENKTEQPTAHRLQKAREEGQVPQSQEMASAVTLIALVGTTALLGPWFVRWCKQIIREGLSCDTSVAADSQVFISFVNGKIIDSLMMISPFLLALVVAGVGGSIMVSGLNYAPKSLEWKLDKLNPVTGLKNMFSPENLFKLVLSIAKLIMISIIVWVYVKENIPTLARLQWAQTDQLLGGISGLILGVIIRIMIGVIVIGAADWFYRKWRHIEKLKMTKNEVKDERRDNEGAPEIKSKIRQKQFEAAMKRMLADVPKANVVLVNPTHVAVALQYDPKTMGAPVLLAKGGDHMCEKIKEIARANGIPIIRRPALARELFGSVELGHVIPEKLFTAVAEILALLYRIRHSG